MSKVVLAADPTVQTAAMAVATASGTGAWIATATDIALAIFGVPLQAVLAAACGAFGAGAMQDATTYRRAVCSGIMWTVAGIMLSHLVYFAIEWATGKQMPTGALSGAALIASAGGRLSFTKENVSKLRAAVGRLLDGIGAKK